MTTDLLIANADLVVTMDGDRSEIQGGWVAMSGGFITAVGRPGEEPAAARVVVAIIAW